ncbi:hypothetical protein BV20DRAFT_1053297 [Pilatotrama ljubarskyi]|nr:hypothetical protein BV20DRAFT_1053297 [Pilatotrama ljubarskyi]
MPLSLPPPPPQPLLFDLERPPSPAEEEDVPSTAYEGIELTVYGLNRTTPLSASEHLRRLIEETKARPGLSTEAQNALVPHPWADLLQGVRKSLIETYPDIRAQWRTHAGLDKTRRLTFAMDSQAQAQEVRPKIDKWLEKRKYCTLMTFTSRASGTWRIIYDFLDPAHVDAIFHSLPVIGGCTYYPTRPRFIIPSYGYQIAILGCRDWQSAKTTLDHCIELGGDVYTAVLHDWDSTLKVTDSGPVLEAFLSRHILGRHISSPPQPGLLYCLNSSGLFLRQGATDRERSSLELQQLRHELDAVRQQGLEQIRTLYSTLALTNDAITAMSARLDHSLAVMTNLAAQHALDMQANQLEFSIADLRREHDQCQLILVLSEQVPEEMCQHSLRRMRECEEQLNDRRRQVMELWKRMSILGPRSPTPGEPTLPPPTPSPVPAPAVPPVEASGFPETASPRELNMDTAPPHIWVLNETKSPHPMSDRIHTPGYHKYESPGLKLDRGRGGKWGVIVGVKPTLHAQQLDTDPRFCGRLIALDIVISTTNGRGYIHRFLGLYAPWDPGAEGAATQEFWQYVAGLCCAAPHSWSIIGDCNTTMLSSGSLGRTHHSASRLAYSEFLRTSNGIDVWASQGDSAARYAFTCKSSSGLGLSVIDRVAISRRGIYSATCMTLQDFIPATDHWAVRAMIALAAPLSVDHAALQSPDDPSILVTSASGIKEATVRYFSSLFTRTPRVPSQKPWMTTPSIAHIHLRMLLRKGNPRPSPGPDLWEKWCIKALSDSALSHSVKPAIVSTIFKRGVRTDLANYRGITCSNLLKNLPFAGRNQLLAPYAAEHGILPQTQVATQPRVQARDLVSFLAQVDVYAHRHKQPLFVLRRDQQKGFDRLEPEGFYDAVQAYGLPRALADLDRSAQHCVPYQVKTAYGLTTSFTVSGVTQQGGPFSPLKSTLTTSMVNHWLSDVMAPEDCLTLMSRQGALGKPHIPDDHLHLRVLMVEAMDDSILLMPSLTALRTAALHADHFQAAYGWETNWAKSLLYTTQPPPSFGSNTTTMPSVDPTNPDSPHTTLHPVPITTNFFEFLRIQINDPNAQYEKIRHIISHFSFPNLPTRLPLTALRRILTSCLVSRIRPYLSYQPLPRSSVLDLDRLLAHHIHDYLGFPFHFSTHLLFAPLSHLGFEFCSLSQLNDAAAIEGLLRDLNHHVPAF